MTKPITNFTNFTIFTIFTTATTVPSLEIDAPAMQPGAEPRFKTPFRQKYLDRPHLSSQVQQSRARCIRQLRNDDTVKADEITIIL